MRHICKLGWNQRIIIALHYILYSLRSTQLNSAQLMPHQDCLSMRPSSIQLIFRHHCYRLLDLLIIPYHLLDGNCLFADLFIFSHGLFFTFSSPTTKENDNSNEYDANKCSNNNSSDRASLDLSGWRYLRQC